MLVWIVALFFVCWSPLETMLLFMEFTNNTFPEWWSDFEWISYFMAYANTAINPYIYAGMSENYQLGLKRLKERVLSRGKYYDSNVSSNIRGSLAMTPLNSNVRQDKRQSHQLQ